MNRQHSPLQNVPADALDDRALRLGAYIAEHAATVRSTAAVFGISKSTVHKDITVRLPQLHAGLAAQVREIIEKNKQERHIRGGLATKRKYERQRCTARLPHTEDSVHRIPHVQSGDYVTIWKQTGKSMCLRLDETEKK